MISCRNSGTSGIPGLFVVMYAWIWVAVSSPNLGGSLKIGLHDTSLTLLPFKIYCWGNVLSINLRSAKKFLTEPNRQLCILDEVSWLSFPVPFPICNLEHYTCQSSFKKRQFLIAVRKSIWVENSQLLRGCYSVYLGLRCCIPGKCAHFDLPAHLSIGDRELWKCAEFRGLFEHIKVFASRNMEQVILTTNTGRLCVPNLLLMFYIVAGVVDIFITNISFFFDKACTIIKIMCPKNGAP